MTMQIKNKLVLIGFMGTGKSSVAESLSNELSFPVVDVDAYIVEQAGQSIPDIFEQHGEEYFRRLETEALSSIMTSEQSVIVATGGGAVLKDENKELMLKYGQVFALSARPQVIIDRVKNDANRPLLQGDVEKRVYDLLEKRKKSYTFAHYTIDTSDLNLQEIVEKICLLWNKN